MKRATLTPHAEVMLLQQTFDFEKKPRRTRAVLLEDKATAQEAVDPDPAIDPRFKDNLTSWFFSNYDGPPVRPGVFWTFIDSHDGSLERTYGWQLWSGIQWYEQMPTMHRSRQHAAPATTAPTAYQGLKTDPWLLHHAQVSGEQPSH